MRVYVHNTPASKPRTALTRTACKVTWRRGPVHAPLTLSQSPPCHRLAYPRHADANTSSLPQHQLWSDDHPPSTSSKHRGLDCNPKHIFSLEFSCTVGFSSKALQSSSPVTSGSSSPNIHISNNIGAWRNMYNTDLLTSLSNGISNMNPARKRPSRNPTGKPGGTIP